jgi:peptide-methionine (S)-S-oxide reductase
MIDRQPKAIAVPRTRTKLSLAAMLLLPLAILALWHGVSGAQEAPVVIPAPTQDITDQSGPAVAVLAGGCFWGVQGVFQHVKGVTKAVSGYTGGAADTAFYEMTGSGQTGHAESVQITYDPSVISYGELLQIYFSVAHNPTHGTQYRSTIFAQNDEQANVAKAYIAQLDTAKAYSAPIVTTIETGKTFYPAEQYHQDFLTLNPTYPYIAINDLPKVAALKQIFPKEYADQPVLVGQL